MMHYGLHVIRVNVGTLIILPRLHFLSAFLSPAYLYSLIPPLAPPLPPALFRATSLNFPPIYNSLKRLHLHLAFPLSAAPGGVRGVSGGAALALASASKPLLSRDLKVLKLLREFVRVRVGVCACRSVRVCTYTRASLGSWVLSY